MEAATRGGGMCGGVSARADRGGGGDDRSLRPERRHHIDAPQQLRGRGGHPQRRDGRRLLSGEADAVVVVEADPRVAEHREGGGAKVSEQAERGRAHGARGKERAPEARETAAHAAQCGRRVRRDHCGGLRLWLGRGCGRGRATAALPSVASGGGGAAAGGASRWHGRREDPKGEGGGEQGCGAEGG
eukprot:3172754-Prymnesium_polylepis.1